MEKQYFGLGIYLLGVVNFHNVKRMGVRNQNKHKCDGDLLKKSGEKTVLPPTFISLLLRPWKQQSTVDPQIVIREVFKESTWVWGTGGGGLDGKKAHAHSRKPPRNKDAY